MMIIAFAQCKANIIQFESKNFRTDLFQRFCLPHSKRKPAHATGHVIPLV